MWAAETVQGRFLRSQNGCAVLSSWPGVPAGGRPRWAAGHPFAAAGGGMMGFAVHWPAGSITWGDHAKYGGHDLHDPRRPGKAEGGVHATLGRCSRAVSYTHLTLPTKR